MNTEEIRSQFPILSSTVYGKPLIYLDNAATSQSPLSVVEAITEAYTTRRANVHRGVHCLSQKATDAMEAGRHAAAAFINAPEVDEVIFTRGTTESINLVAASYGQLLNEGDEVIITVMEHHSNIVPWQLLRERRGIVIKVVPMLADGSLDLDAYRNLFTPRTRLVSVCHASNVLGTINPIAEMSQIAHRHGAVICVDGAQGVPHLKVDVQALGCDFYAFSAHKMYGPTGIGILWGRRELLEAMPPYQGGGEMIAHVSFDKTTWAELPFKFEAGTPDYIGAAAFAQAVDFMQTTGIDNIAAHEMHLLNYAMERITEIPGIRIFGTAWHKCAVISFLIGNAHHYDTGMLLDKLGIAVRTGHHCAQPLMAALGIEGTVRASFAVYNTEAEVDTFIQALKRIAPMLN
ncbi:MAG: cysteine desulfurase [Muribaculaceae bacterium]|nr:cysteine desulfurase [Muribaculaceae bacterium]